MAGEPRRPPGLEGGDALGEVRGRQQLGLAAQLALQRCVELAASGATNRDIASVPSFEHRRFLHGERDLLASHLPHAMKEKFNEWVRARGKLYPSPAGIVAAPVADEDTPMS